MAASRVEPSESAPTPVTAAIHVASAYASASASSPSPSHRVTGLADEARSLSSSFASRLSILWGDNPSRSTDGRGTHSTDASSSIHFTGSTLNIVSPNFGHQRSKSTSSKTSITSQPVLVRTYSNVERSRASSANNSIRHQQSMPSSPSIPSLDAFSFDGVLRAIEPDIHETIDGIAEIYARSRLSLADDHGAHLPPQGEILPPRLRHSGLAIRTMGLERTLTTVTEASSSSERLAGGSKAGSIASGKGKATAYGSLRSIISRGRSSSHSSSAQAETPTLQRPVSSSWSIASDRQPSIIIKSRDPAPNQLSLAWATEASQDVARPSVTEEMPDTSISLPTSRRPTSWFSWRTSWSSADNIQPTTRRDAKHSLLEALQNSSSSHQ